MGELPDPSDEKYLSIANGFYRDFIVSVVLTSRPSRESPYRLYLIFEPENEEVTETEKFYFKDEGNAIKKFEDIIQKYKMVRFETRE